MSTRCTRCQSMLPPNARRCTACGTTLNPTRVDLNLGRSLGNLKLLSRLGAGSLGTVYRAEHQSLGTPYAVKVLHPKFSHEGVHAERFRRETALYGRLRHENTVAVIDFGVDKALGMFLVMEYIDGSTLKELLTTQHPFGLGRFGRIALQLCDSLGQAHQEGIVHRNLTPSNVMLHTSASRPDFVKVFDFGMAHFLNVSSEHGDEQPAHSELLSPAYLSPEQVEGSASVGPLSDVYALGTVFYEMLAGRPPFVNKSNALLLAQHITSLPDPVSAHRPELADSRLEGLIAMMLAKKPALRPSSMDEVRSMLGAALEELRAAAPPERAHEPPKEPGSPRDSKSSLSPAAPRFSRPPREASVEKAHEESLVEKLKKPMTADNFRAVLDHEFRIFGKKSVKP